MAKLVIAATASAEENNNFVVPLPPPPNVQLDNILNEPYRREPGEFPKDALLYYTCGSEINGS